LNPELQVRLAEKELWERLAYLAFFREVGSFAAPPAKWGEAWAMEIKLGQCAHQSNVPSYGLLLLLTKEVCGKLWPLSADKLKS